MIWSNIDVDHVRPISTFDVSKDEELGGTFTWKKTQILLRQDHQQKGTKSHFPAYSLQFVEDCQIIKINEERPNENLH